MTQRDEKLPTDRESIAEKVRERYGSIARGETSGCCGSTCGGERTVAVGIGYDPAALAGIPPDANLGLGCGAPIQLLGLKPGERVLDLGSGGGIDAFLAAREVGPSGRVIGVDMTPDMIERARRNAERAGLSNVEFREGRLEALPLDDASVDAVTSNCVINLVPDKRAVFREIARVLRPGGRLVVSDIVLDGDLPEPIAQDVLAYVGCVAGAMRRERYFGLVREAGLGSVVIHRDVDYLAASGDALSDDLKERIAEAGLPSARLAGVVRSVTYGAIRER